MDMLYCAILIMDTRCAYIFTGKLENFPFFLFSIHIINIIYYVWCARATWIAKKHANTVNSIITILTLFLYTYLPLTDPPTYTPVMFVEHYNTYTIKTYSVIITSNARISTLNFRVWTCSVQLPWGTLDEIEIETIFHFDNVLAYFFFSTSL